MPNKIGTHTQVMECGQLPKSNIVYRRLDTTSSEFCDLKISLHKKLLRVRRYTL